MAHTVTSAAPGTPRPARILVTGAIAIDYCATYPGRFATLPRHHGINLSIQVERLEQRFGGCAANIAYSLALLGHAPTPCAFVGGDFDGAYRNHLAAAGVDLAGIVAAPDAPHSARGFVFTDRDGNQFTSFYSGPARDADLGARLAALLETRQFDHAVCAPDLPPNMIAAARLLNDAAIPFLCDPGQCLTDFSTAQTRELAGLATELVVNRYEFETLRERCGGVPDVERLLVTLGADGSRCGALSVPAAPAREVADPTGCGDAWRAGYVAASLSGAPLRDAMRAGGSAAAMSLEARGAQSHRFDEFAARYAAVWGDCPQWLAGFPTSTQSAVAGDA